MPFNPFKYRYFFCKVNLLFFVGHLYLAQIQAGDILSLLGEPYRESSYTDLIQEVENNGNTLNLERHQEIINELSGLMLFRGQEINKVNFEKVVFDQLDAKYNAPIRYKWLVFYCTLLRYYKLEVEPKFIPKAKTIITELAETQNPHTEVDKQELKIRYKSDLIGFLGGLRKSNDVDQFLSSLQQDVLRFIMVLVQDEKYDKASAIYSFLALKDDLIKESKEEKVDISGDEEEPDSSPITSFEKEFLQLFGAAAKNPSQDDQKHMLLFFKKISDVYKNNGATFHNRDNFIKEFQKLETVLKNPLPSNLDISSNDDDIIPMDKPKDNIKVIYYTLASLFFALGITTLSYTLYKNYTKSKQDKEDQDIEEINGKASLKKKKRIFSFFKK